MKVGKVTSTPIKAPERTQKKVQRTRPVPVKVPEKEKKVNVPVPA